MEKPTANLSRKEDQEYYGSENYAQMLEEDERLWHEAYDERINKKIEIFDRLLCIHTEESYALIERLSADEMSQVVQKRNTDYGFMVIFTQIYHAQKQAGEQPYFLDYGDCLADLETLLQQIKFCMWEIEFLHEKESEDILAQIIRQYDMQPVLLRNLIKIASMDRNGMTKKLMEVSGIKL